MKLHLHALLLATLAAGAQGQSTVRVSVATGGIQLPGATAGPSISGDGRYVIFSSNAAVLPGTLNSIAQVFVHDRDPDGNGVFDEGNSTTSLLSRTPNGQPGNGSTGQSSISDDGRWVAFTTNATNFSSHTWVAGGSYLLDRDSDQDGIFDELPVSYYPIRAPGSLPPNASLGEYEISAGGAYVAFTSLASNLVPGDLNGKHDVFRWERATGTIVRASVSDTGVEGNAFSRHGAISDDGNRIAFETQATTLAPGISAFGGEVLYRDIAAGTTHVVSVSNTGALGNNLSLLPDISADGNFVAFASYAGNFDPRDTDFNSDVYVRDLAAGVTELVSVDSFGNKGTGGSTDPFVSHDGNRVCFASQATNLYWNDSFAARDVFVRDRTEGWTRQASVASDGEHGNNVSAEAFGIDFSSDGAHPVFYSEATNLVAGDTNGKGDLFVHDVCPDGGIELGFVTPGTGGLVPELRACGPLSTGSQATLSVVNARPSRLAAAFWSAGQSNLPFLGGTLVPSAPYSVLRSSTDSSGKLQLSVPGGGGPGTRYVQVLVRDGFAPQGVAFSNALELQLLP